MSDAAREYLWQQRHQALTRARLACMYHRRRERWFDALDRASSVIGIVGGSSALVAIGNDDAVRWVALAPALASAVVLVYGFAAKARLHADLAAEYIGLERDILLRGEREFTESDVARWHAQHAAIGAREPRTLGALVVECQNEQAIAAGHRECVVPIPMRARLLRHLFDWQPSAA